jgi:hypothetical protein
MIQDATAREATAREEIRDAHACMTLARVAPYWMFGRKSRA